MVNNVYECLVVTKPYLTEVEVIQPSAILVEGGNDLSGDLRATL